MSQNTTADCHRCIHFRRAPDQARREGCYLPSNMPMKQKDRFLDEQQIPGNHEKINLRGDCPDFEALQAKPSWWERIFSLGA